MQHADYWRRMASSEDREAEFALVCQDVEKEVAAFKIEAMDLLQELAQAHGLVRKVGQDRCQEIMARAFGWRGLAG